MSVTLEFSDNVSRSTCAEQHGVKLQSDISQFQYIVTTERTIMDTLSGINEERKIAKVTPERRRIDDDWYSHNYVRIVADMSILSCMIRKPIQRVNYFRMKIHTHTTNPNPNKTVLKRACTHARTQTSVQMHVQGHVTHMLARYSIELK